MKDVSDDKHINVQPQKGEDNSGDNTLVNLKNKEIHSTSNLISCNLFRLLRSAFR